MRERGIRIDADLSSKRFYRGRDNSELLSAVYLRRTLTSGVSRLQGVLSRFSPVRLQ